MMGFENATIAIFVLYAAVLLLGGERVHTQMHWVVLGFILLIWGLRLVQRLWNALLVRREVIAFRSLDAEQREAFLAAPWPRGLRYEYVRRVDMNEVHDVNGAMERFPFPRAERALHWRLFWMAFGLAMLPLLAGIFLVALPPPLRIAAVLVGAFAVVPVAWLTGRLALLSSQLEVTPFSVALLWPAGRRVALSLNQPLLLVNQPAGGFCELRQMNGAASLRIHHARLASMRAIDLIAERGGFEPVPDHQQRAT